MKNVCEKLDYQVAVIFLLIVILLIILLSLFTKDYFLGLILLFFIVLFAILFFFFFKPCDEKGEKIREFFTFQAPPEILEETKSEARKIDDRLGCPSVAKNRISKYRKS
jgi:Ca2+/Na+ antiporter